MTGISLADAESEDKQDEQQLSHGKADNAKEHTFDPSSSAKVNGVVIPEAPLLARVDEVIE